MSLVLACTLTVLIETPFFALFGYRSKDEITVTACANVATNLLLNLGLSVYPGAPVFVAEAAVTLSEYAAYALAFGRSRRLFSLTLAANLLSFACSYPLACFLR